MCPPLCGKSVQIQKRGKREVRENKKKMVRWAVDKKEDWGKKKEMEVVTRVFCVFLGWWYLSTKQLQNK